MRRRTVLLGAGSTVLAASLGLALGGWRGDPAQIETDARLPLPLTAMTWRLTDQRGDAVRSADLVGRPTMVFFGFTWCPDVCPTTLTDIAGWRAELGAEAADMRVVLVTVDPARDTPDVLGAYLAHFDPDIVGLTGTAEQVRAAAADFRAVYQTVPLQDGGYTMNHTAGVILYAADGSFSGIIDFHEDRRFALPKIRRMLTRTADRRGG